jgi:hypothetical protein
VRLFKHPLRMQPLRFSEEFASIAHCTNDRTFAAQRICRQRAHCQMIISQQHTRAFHGPGIGDR